MMRLLKLAARNLTRNLRRSLLTGAAIAFGLAMMVLMITLQEGSYKEMLRSGISTLAGHVVIEDPEYTKEEEPEYVVHDVAALSAKLQEALPTAVIAPRMQVGGLLTSPTNSVGIGLRGVRAAAESQVTDFDEKVVEGEWLDDADDRGILIGVAMADRLGVGLGDKVVFMGQSRGGEVESRLFRVKGLFRTGGAELDSFVGMTTLGPVQELNATPDAAHQITVHLQNPRAAHEAREIARSVTPAGLSVLTWDEALPDIVALIKLDRVSADVMMIVIGLIVAMGVLNTVLMSVMERVREFGVLLGIGMRPGRVATLVLAEGLVLGLISTGVGIVVGLALAWPLVHYGLDYSAFMGGDTMEMEGIVVSAVIKGAYGWGRIAQYSFGAIVFTVLSAIYPAWYITRLEPVQAMRNV
ncbi:MAG: FtsX-like permease family protein [Myxococcota bacterium]